MLRFPVASLPIFYLLVSFVNARLTTLDDLDPRLQWTPQVEATASQCQGQPANERCTGSWWVETWDDAFSRGEHFTYGPASFMKFQFRGSQFMIFGTQFVEGGKGIVTVDGNITGEFDSKRSDGRRQQMLFRQTDLDPIVQHTVKVSYDTKTFNVDQRTWVGIDFVLLDEYDDEATPSSPAPTVSVGPSSSVTELAAETVSSKTTVNVLIVASAILGVLLVLLLGIVLLLLRRHRKKKAMSSLLPSTSPSMHIVPLSLPVATQSGRSSTVASIDRNELPPAKVSGRSHDSMFFPESSAPLTDIEVTSSAFSSRPPIYNQKN